MNQTKSADEKTVRTLYDYLQEIELTCVMLAMKNGNQQITNVPIMKPMVNTARYSRRLSTNALVPAFHACLSTFRIPASGFLLIATEKQFKWHENLLIQKLSETH